MSAIMYDKGMFEAAGLKAPLKYSNTIDQNGRPVTPSLKYKNLSYDNMVRIIEEQDLREYVDRYQWVNVPKGLNYKLIERILYYRGKALLHFNSNVNKYQFLPFALNRTIDEYGRFTRCNTLVWSGNSTDEKGQLVVSNDIEIVYDDLYTQEDLMNPEGMDMIMQEWMHGSDKGIIINDHCQGISQNVSTRASIVQPIIASLATCWQIINTAMFASADYSWVNGSEEIAESLQRQLDTVNERILQGQRFGIITSNIPVTQLTSSNSNTMQSLWETFNSIDNFRKCTAGIANAGVFNKKETMLVSEQALNGSNADAIYSDGLLERQQACDLFNQYYGGNIWCMSKKTPTQPEQMGSTLPQGQAEQTPSVQAQPEVQND